jgi:hypothetical protein
MQQPCQNCGFESPASDRYCRQCGAPLIVETDTTAASTRNYPRKEEIPSPYSSGQLRPSVGDVIAGETERYYQAPSVAAGTPPDTAHIKSKLRFWSRFSLWRSIFMLLVLCIGLAIGAAVFSLIRPPRSSPPMPPEERARVEQQQRAQRRLEQQRREAENRVRETEERAREAERRQLEAVERAREAAERAIEAGAAIPLGDEKLLDLSQYEYQNATVGNSIRIPGHELLTMRTRDSFDVVKEYYQKRLGKPVIQINEDFEKKLLFQSNTSPPVAVSVETEGPIDQLKSTVLRSPYRFPRPDEAVNKQ